MMTKDDIELLFRTHYRKMLILANTLLHDEDAARDIVHDVFTSLLTGKTESVNEAYLLGGVRFACLKRIRSLSVEERLKKLYSIDCDEVEVDEWPDERIIALIRSVIDCELPEMTGRIVRLRFYDRLTYKEIARLLSVSEVTVYKHLHHAVDVIRKKLKDHEG
ncbi:MAG: sigma-70 family RNA polymerase sigma factor [Muribaculaceae bacterium]|nr:sigma-70 family RNA polymerase sigma factor [Muribaculaceae bacterium]